MEVAQFFVSPVVNVRREKGYTVEEYSLFSLPMFDPVRITLRERHPKLTEGKFAINTECDMFVYCISGIVRLCLGKYPLHEISIGMTAIIPKGTKYFWDKPRISEGLAEVVLLVVCTPKWTPEQHTLVFE